MYDCERLFASALISGEPGNKLFAGNVDTRIPSALSSVYIHEMLKPMDDKMRGPGAFGPKVDPPAGADEQTELLCFLGRHV